MVLPMPLEHIPLDG